MAKLGKTVEEILNDIILKSEMPTTAVLTASGWDNKSQTVSIEGITEDSVVIVSPSGEPTNYASAGIYCSAQGNGTLTFTCETVPTTDITVNILRW